MTNIKDLKCVNVYDAGDNSKEILTCMKYNQKITAIYCSDSISCDYFKPAENDNISHPNHYTQGKIEVWDFISDQKLNYNRGCIIKYICRAGIKDKSTELEDLKKAMAYLEKEIKETSK